MVGDGLEERAKVASIAGAKALRHVLGRLEEQEGGRAVRTRSGEGQQPVLGGAHQSPPFVLSIKRSRLAGKEGQD